MRNRRRTITSALPACLALLVAAGALCVGQAEPGGSDVAVPPADEVEVVEPASVESEPPAGLPADAVAPAADVEPVTVKDPLYPLEFRLPAPYWDYRDQEDLRAELSARGGCAGPGQTVPENLLFVFGHKDAAVYGRLELGPRSFLLRGKDELEAYTDARAAVIQSQTGGPAQNVQTHWLDKDGMLVHRLEFSAPLRARGGCGAPPPPQAGGERMHYLILHYFVRPRDADALCFFMFFYAPETTFRELQAEVDRIVDSVRYHGELAADFFDPQAPLEKAITAEDADTGQKKSPLGGFLMPALLVLAIWMMMRRRKPKAEE
jgi:hypothetical protein